MNNPCRRRAIYQQNKKKEETFMEHNKVTEAVEEFTCDNCGRKFKKALHLGQHVKSCKVDDGN